MDHFISHGWLTLVCVVLSVFANPGLYLAGDISLEERGGISECALAGLVWGGFVCGLLDAFVD